jgi:hypothetical protein
MWFLLLPLVVQALLIVHVIKTGRNQIWIWVLALLPGAGIIAYLAIELLPELLGSRTTRHARTYVKKALNPGGELKQLAQRAEIGGSVDARQRHAEELLRLGRHEEAVAEFRRTLTGLYEHDPNLMLGLARAQFAAGAVGDARATLDDLIKHNPDFRSPDGHLLYARALHGEGQTARALEEYKTLAAYYPGAEAAVRYAALLRKQGETQAAAEVLRTLLDQAAIAPRHYRRAQDDWLKEARRELAALKQD